MYCMGITLYAIYIVDFKLEIWGHLTLYIRFFVTAPGYRSKVNVYERFQVNFIFKTFQDCRY